MSETELKTVVASYGVPSESLQGVRRAFELPWEVEPAIAVALVEAFLSVRPDHEHPPHGHHDLVALATTDFLALATVVVVALRRVRRS